VTGSGLLVVTMTGGDESGALSVKMTACAGAAPLTRVRAQNGASKRRSAVISDSLNWILVLRFYARLFSGGCPKARDIGATISGRRKSPPAEIIQKRRCID
jgi:hypothetical protein